jgi:hypothetical protein
MDSGVWMLFAVQTSHLLWIKGDFAMIEGRFNLNENEMYNMKELLVIYVRTTETVP